METKHFLKGLPLAAIVVLFMACGNNEAAKTESVTNNPETTVSQPGDSTNMKQPEDASKDSTSASKGKEDDEDKENEKDD
jgi:PBP1b-binding outer membrane lipoprotein LpoB